MKLLEHIPKQCKQVRIRVSHKREKWEICQESQTPFKGGEMKPQTDNAHAAQYVDVEDSVSKPVTAMLLT